MNELNNFPICQGPNFKDLSELDVLTPNRLLLGRNNRRSMSGPCTVDSKSRMLEAIEAVIQAWWVEMSNQRFFKIVCFRFPNVPKKIEHIRF
jgi:hypothetical protein